MKCVVTAGPTIEPLDQVRRLTNFSTGRLGTRLASFLAERGHEVDLLLGETAQVELSPSSLTRVTRFASTDDLWQRLQQVAEKHPPLALFHAAAVSDYRVGRIQNSAGQEIKGGKIETAAGTLQVELIPTRKILPELRDLFPQALIVGWKYEVEGDRGSVMAKCRRQLQVCRSNASVGNGPAYGLGFGLVTPMEENHFRDPEELFKALLNLMEIHQREGSRGC